LDIGANVGYYTLIAAKLVGPEGRVVAIEPAPDNYARLCRNVELNYSSNVVTVPCAISDAERNLRLSRRVTDNSGAYTLLPVGQTRESPRVRVRTLDSVLDELAVRRVDFVKIDVEGFEFKALSRSRIFTYQPVIVTEIYDPLLMHAESSAEQYVQLLEGRGYSVARIPRGDLNFLCISQR